MHSDSTLYTRIGPQWLSELRQLWKVFADKGRCPCSKQSIALHSDLLNASKGKHLTSPDYQQSTKKAKSKPWNPETHVHMTQQCHRILTPLSRSGSPNTWCSAQCLCVHVQSTAICCLWHVHTHDLPTKLVPEYKICVHGHIHRSQWYVNSTNSQQSETN